jgi:hypothetical protein
MNLILEVSDEEHVEIANLLLRLRKDAAVRALSPTLTEDEKRLLLNHDLVGAVRDVRERLGCSLFLAKELVDVVRDAARNAARSQT